MAKLNDLPNELLRNLFLMISLKDRKMAALVSWRWRKIGEDPVLWKWCIICIRNRHDINKLYHRRIHHVQQIKVSGGEWKTEQLEQLFKATLELPKLTKIGLWDIDLRSVNSRLLARALVKLEELVISENHLATNDQQRLDIFNEIPKYGCIKKLYMAELNLGALGVEPEILAKVMSGLKELEMNSVSFTNGQVREIFKSISENNELTKVDFSWLNLSSVDPEILGNALAGIETVDLQQIRLSHQQLRSLFTKMGQNTKIKAFHLVENNLSAAEPRVFARGLSKLEEVVLIENNLSNDQVRALFLELKQNCKLKSLELAPDDLSSVEADDLAAVVTNLEEVDLRSTRLSADQITAILTRARLNNNLKKLDLRENCRCGVDSALVTLVRERIGDGFEIDCECEGEGSGDENDSDGESDN